MSAKSACVLWDLSLAAPWANFSARPKAAERSSRTNNHYDDAYTATILIARASDALTKSAIGLHSHIFNIVDLIIVDLIIVDSHHANVKPSSSELPTFDARCGGQIQSIQIKI